MESVLIFAPNWLGDAVMALPAIADVRRAFPGARVAVAARRSVAPLFTLVPGVDAVVELGRARASAGSAKASAERFETALLLPNSFNAALLAWRAGIPERWGYRGDWRTPLLTRSVRRPRRVHQVAYYQRLVAALGIPNGPAVPRVQVSAGAIRSGARLLADAGWNGHAPMVGLAPGAAYGGAKRWPPRYFGELVRDLAADGCRAVLVGSAADRATGIEVEQAARTDGVINLIGRTSLVELAGVLHHCGSVVSNDSGAMHVAAAAGLPVVALFGPTDETATAPLSEPEGPHLPPRVAVLTHHVWCRPCMLRECPIGHGCMKGITVEAVRAAVKQQLSVSRRESSVRCGEADPAVRLRFVENTGCS